MITDALCKIANHRANLSREESRTVMGELLAGKATDAQVAALLVALHMKGETVEEIVGFAEAIRAAAVPLSNGDGTALDISGTERDALVDTCGTGGDASDTFNISTVTALTIAGAGVRVAKHGNRGITSKCGSADVMEALGVNITIPPQRIADCLREVGIAFMFAPAMHAATKHVQPARKDLRPLRSVFNLLGPLTNPARASAQVVGVYSVDLVEKLAQALKLLGLERALVVHGADGLDEISISGPTKIGEVRGEWVRVYEVTPEQFGLQRAPMSAILGGDLKTNADIIWKLLEGEKSPRRDIVLMNAAAALVAAGRADSLADAMPLAVKSMIPERPAPSWPRWWSSPTGDICSLCYRLRTSPRMYTLQTIASNAQIAKDRRKWNLPRRFSILAFFGNFRRFWQFSCKVLPFCGCIYNRLSP